MLWFNFSLGMSLIWVFPKIGGFSPQIIHSILMGFSIINHPFWDTPIFGNIHMILILFAFFVPYLELHFCCIKVQGTAYSDAGCRRNEQQLLLFYPLERVDHGSWWSPHVYQDVNIHSCYCLKKTMIGMIEMIHLFENHPLVDHVAWGMHGASINNTAGALRVDSQLLLPGS